MNGDAAQKLEAYSTPEPNTGCQIYWGAQVRGYGYLRLGAKTRRAARVAWELQNGAIPSGLTIDHLCDNPSCVNAGHLRLATPAQNTLRNKSPFSVNKRKTHCLRGHLLAGKNIAAQPDGRRRCRTCHNARHRVGGAI